ncbi:unnamed protein product [Fusarium fujikuroi]|nr:unnamed protein product [Fusarium fujikuroi]
MVSGKSKRWSYRYTHSRYILIADSLNKYTSIAKFLRDIIDSITRIEIRVLLVSHNELAIRDALTDGLNRLYDHNWTKITKLGEEERDRAFTLLCWAAFALQPLTVCKITEAALILTSGELLRNDFPNAVDDNSTDFIALLLSKGANFTTADNNG